MQTFMSDRDQHPSPEMLRRMLDEMDTVAYTFDRDRRVIYSNKAARAMLRLSKPGAPIGAAEEHHFEGNKYFDEGGNQLDYPRGSAVEKAFEGEETHNLLLEHRNVKEHKHQWIEISCIPIKKENGEFDYGILWYRDVSRRKSRQDKLKFLQE